MKKSLFSRYIEALNGTPSSNFLLLETALKCLERVFSSTTLILKRKKKKRKKVRARGKQKKKK